MNIHAFFSSGTYHVSVQGSLQLASERLEFLEVLGNSRHSRIELSFFDARVLPAEVVLGLSAFVRANPKTKLRISVFHRYLSGYLFRLGIPCNMVHSSHSGAGEFPLVRAIAIGGSAGSLDKIMTIIGGLSRQEISVFIVQHILENEPNYLGEILKRQTGYSIPSVSDGLEVRPGCIYIAPPGEHLLVEKGCLKLSAGEKVNFARPSIQLTFESLAKEYRQGLVAVLLCGFGSDGVPALPALHSQGVTLVIEDPLDCEAAELVKNAWKTGLVDYKFPLPELSSFLSRIIEPREPRIEETELRQFLGLLHDQYGYDYRHYNSQSAIRRISRVMADNHIYSFRRFGELVLQDQDLFENLFLECSINVTEFFRNPETYARLRNKVLTYLDSFPHIKIWSAGCSTGQEAISVAILLEELGLLQKSQIYASDINPYVLEEATNAIYAQNVVEGSQGNYEQSGGQSRFEGFFDIREGLARLKPHIRERILYFQHSLLNRGAFNEFHLILCRNVLIYFDQNLQQSVLELFSRSLDMNGFLVLGETESMANLPIGFEVFDSSNRIFKKVI